MLFWFPPLFSRNILKTIALGQMLSLCICGTAITSQYLAERYKVNTPMLQSFINYCLLFLIYTMMLAFQSGMSNVEVTFQHTIFIKFLCFWHIKKIKHGANQNQETVVVFIKVVRKKRMRPLKSMKVLARDLCVSLWSHWF